MTERPGTLRVVTDGVLQPEPVRKTPPVLHEGQGGLMDVALDPKFAENGWIYLSYSHVLPSTEEGRPPAMTRLVHGRVMDNEWTFEQVRLLNIRDGRVLHQEIILKNAGRVRTAMCGPDGAIYVVLNGPDAILRLTPIRDVNDGSE